MFTVPHVPHVQASWGHEFWTDPYVQFNQHMQQPMLQGPLMPYNAFMNTGIQGKMFGKGYGKGKSGWGMWNRGTGLGQWGNWNQGMGLRKGFSGGKWGSNTGVGFRNQFADPFHGMVGFGSGWGQGHVMNPLINGIVGGMGGIGGFGKVSIDVISRDFGDYGIYATVSNKHPSWCIKQS